MIAKILGAACGAALMLGATAAQSALIWEDDFNRPTSNTVGNGWTEIEWRNDEASVVNGSSYDYLQLKDYTQNGGDVGVVQTGISTLGYENITVEFKWRPFDTESNDSFELSYQILPLFTWMSVFDTTLGGSETWKTESVALSSFADDIDILDIRFLLDASYKKEGVKIKYVKIYGDEIVGGGGTAEVPEAPAVALFGLALAGLGLTVRRRQRG